MLKNNRGISLILLLIIILAISIIFTIGIILWNHKMINNNIYEADINSSYTNKTIDDISSTKQESLPTYDLFNTYSLFNKKIIYNFGMGTYYEIDMPQIINDYEEIVIRDNLLILSNNDYYVSISKDETLFENLPPEEMIPAGGIRSLYTIVDEDDTTKLFKVTYRDTGFYPDAEVEDKVSYSLYRKDNNCTLKIEGVNKDELLKLLDLITVTNQSKTLEEQFYGITVLDERVIDTSKITISEIYNINNYLKIGINIDGKLIHINFLSENDETYLPTIKRLVDNWNLVAEKEDYKIYHGFTNSAQSDVLKIIKDDKEYFIDLSIPADLYTVQSQKNDNGSTSIYMYLSEELLKKIIDEIFNIF